MTDMQDHPRPETPTDTAALLAAIDRLSARLDRLEHQPPHDPLMTTARTRLAAAWAALRGTDPGDAPAPTGTRAGAVATGTSPLGLVLTVAAGLLAVWLAVEVVDELFDGLWHLWRWID